MNDYTPTTEEVLGMLGAYLYEYGAECDMNLPGNSPDEIVDRWLAAHDAEVAAKAWDQCMQLVRVEVSLDPQVPNAVMRGVRIRTVNTVNPYRKAVQK